MNMHLTINKKTFLSWTLMAGLVFVLWTLPVSATGKYHKKMIKRFSELGITKMPTRDYYAGAASIVILDDITDRQYYGYYSLWDITHVEERNRIWKIVDPSVERIGRITIDLADAQEILSFKVNIYYPDGTRVKLRKRDLLVQDYRDPITWKKYKRGILLLPELVPDTIIELSSKINYNYPKHWDKIYIQGPDPVYTFKYTLTRPAFHRLAPTRYYEPVTQLCIPMYRFRAYDSNLRTYIPVHETNDGYSVTFTNVPTCVAVDHSLPCSNTSSFIEYSVRELLVKNPLDTQYKPEYKQYMNIPAYLAEELKPFPIDDQQAKEDILRRAGSPAAYRISFHNWDFIMDYFYYDILEDMKKSKRFGEFAARIQSSVGSTDRSEPLNRARIIYDHLRQHFETYRSPDQSHRYAPSIKVLEESLDRKTATPLTISLIYWGLLYHSDVHSRIGFSFTQDRFCGKFDRQYPVPIHFNAGVVILYRGRDEFYMYPGDTFVRFGALPPELENADLLVTYFRAQDILRHETNMRRDVLHRFIEKREYPRLSTYWVQLPATLAKSHSIHTTIELSVTEKGTVEGRARTYFSGHSETEIRRLLEQIPADERNEFVGQWYHQQIIDCTLQAAELKYSDNLQKPLIFSIIMEPRTDFSDGRLEVPLSFFSQQQSYTFLWEPAEKRTIFFPYLFTVETTFITHFDETWEIADIPHDAVHSTPQGRFEKHVFTSDNTVIVTRHFHLSQYLYLSKSHEFIRSFFETIFDHEKADRITLVRPAKDILASRSDEMTKN